MVSTERKQSGTLILTLSVLISCLCISSVSAKYAGGSGSSDNPYKIWTAEQMNEIGLHSVDGAHQHRLGGARPIVCDH